MDLPAALAPARLAGIGFVLGLIFLAVTIEAAPLGFMADAWPSPDLVFCIVAYWSLRRPEAVPLTAVYAAGLVRDLMTDAPVGAGALTLVLASEVLKLTAGRLGRRGFGAEWLAVSGVLAAVLASQWLLVLLTLAHPPYLVELGRQWLLTMALYPALAAAFRWLVRVRRPRAETG